MSESPAAVVGDLFERVNSGDIDSVLGRLAPDAVFVVPPEASAEPDTYKGHEGARRYFGGFDGILEDVRFELIDAEEVSADTVLAESRLRGRGAATGIQVAQDTFVVMTVRDGLVTFITTYNDRDSALAALGSGSR